MSGDQRAVNGGIAGVRVRFEPATQADAALRDPHTLAVIGFAAGARPQPGADPRWLQVGLAPLDAPMVEVWHGSAPVQHGRQDDGLCWAEDGSHQMGVLQIEEADFDGDIARASEHAYRTMQQCLASRGYPHLLRIWNYLDAIVDGDGDQERYRQFCIGRARGLGDFDPRMLPAATAIGRVDGVRVLQVYWLAARQPGIPVENPRQVSAYHYPRQYGPQPPSFARAMLPPAGSALPLMLSGTASVVGHRSLHAGHTLRQLEETFANFDALLDSARQHQAGLERQFSANSHLKVYLENAAELDAVQQALAQQLTDEVPRMLLHARVCRPDLHIEIDGWHH